MSELQGFATIKIHDGKLEEYKRLAEKCTELVRSKDTGTLQYESYFNSDQTECMVFERYRHSEALIQHGENLKEVTAALLEICSISGVLCGEPSPELRKSLEGTGVVICSPFQSL